MSLYVRICKGEYDTLLPWPFSLEIDLIIVDQSQDPRGRSDITQTVRPNTCKVSRVSEERYASERASYPEPAALRDITRR